MQDIETLTGPLTVTYGLCLQASSSQAVLVDFTAHWCGPCRLVEPILDQLQKQYEDVKMVKIDADACKGIVDKYKAGPYAALGWLHGARCA